MDVLSVLGDVQQRGLGHGLCSGRVVSVEELVEHRSVFAVVPVSEHDRVLLLPGNIGSDRLGLDHERRSKSVDVLAGVVTVDPVGSLLELSGDLVRERRTGGDGAGGRCEGEGREQTRSARDWLELIVVVLDEALTTG